ncbi:MAG TPA: hypothetical protein VIS07_20925 [Candidatus Binatia bacterium]
MARRRTNTWWWLAIPLAGVAAYAGFVATLSWISGPDANDAPAPKAAFDGRSLQPAAPVDAPAAPADVPYAGVEVTPPQPTATAVEQRAADAAGASTAKGASGGKRALPREDLTEQDRRALERVIERAVGGKR